MICKNMSWVQLTGDFKITIDVLRLKFLKLELVILELETKIKVIGTIYGRFETYTKCSWSCND